MPPFPNGVLNVASAADVGDSLFTRELAKNRIREEHSEWSDMDLNRERIRRAFLQRLVPALERIIMGPDVGRLQILRCSALLTK
jgi:hypothetical protein